VLLNPPTSVGGGLLSKELEYYFGKKFRYNINATKKRRIESPQILTAAKR
jgi:hypothetical protein